MSIKMLQKILAAWFALQVYGARVGKITGKFIIADPYIIYSHKIIYAVAD
jgi:hypothetical protein